MTWSAGHVWMMNAFLPPGTYPFKVVVYTPGQRPEAARWENGPNRNLTIEAESPELGSAALVLVECNFDQTANTNTQTKRVTGIGFKATALNSGSGNPHLSSNGAAGSVGGVAAAGMAGAALPSARAMASNNGSGGAGSNNSAADSYRASIMAAAGIPTSKVTANARPAVAPTPPQQQAYQVPQQQQHQQQQMYQQQVFQQQQQEAYFQQQQQQMHQQMHHEQQEQQMQHEQLLQQQMHHEQPLPQPAAAPIAATPVAAPPVAAVNSGAAGSLHSPPPEVQAAAQVCKEDPGAADACRVVTRFIQGEVAV